jgi:hypothetical protein
MRSKEVALAFESALGQKDYDAARRLLADDVSFRGPIDTFDRADAYIGALQRLGTMVERIDVLKAFEDGDDVAIFCELHMRAPLPTAFVAEWYGVRNGKIQSVRVAFDARPFAPPGKR